MIITVFRSRLDPAHADSYAAMAKTMGELVSDMPGLISYKGFQAADGERVTIVEFENEEAHNAWRDHPKHQLAMEMGKNKFYEEYKVQVCDLKRESAHKRADKL